MKLATAQFAANRGSDYQLYLNLWYSIWNSIDPPVSPRISLHLLSPCSKEGCSRTAMPSISFCPSSQPLTSLPANDRCR